MAYCSNCGHYLVDETNFCSNCGHAINSCVSEQHNPRKMTYDGKVHKCPNCGEFLEAFIPNCTACGYELRNVKTSDAVKAFFLKIENVKSTEEKAILIRNFPIPNTREDIFEFIIFASTNTRGESSKEVFNAWTVKLEQCYQKAELLFRDDTDFKKIRKTYGQTQKGIYMEKNLHGIKGIGNTITYFYSNMKNPIFGVIFTIVIVANIGAMIVGSFESDGTSIFLAVVVLIITYIITNKKR